jgi:hypothetical protein
MTCERAVCDCLGAEGMEQDRYCSEECWNATAGAIQGCRCGHAGCVAPRVSSNGVEKGWSWTGALLGSLVFGATLLGVGRGYWDYWR